MAGNEATKKYRQAIADAFVKSLTESPKDWKRGWITAGPPQNGMYGYKYKGVNQFFLQFVMQTIGGESDPRFYTFHQIQLLQEKNPEIKLRKGSHGFQVEYWMHYDVEDKKKVSYREARELEKEGKEVRHMSRYTTVFHASQIDGLAPFIKNINTEVSQRDLIEKIAKNMKLTMRNDGGDHAFYSPTTDSVHLPSPSRFESQAVYDGVALHEIAHATGAKHRLNREFGLHGTDAYAREELVAEITSCFTCSALQYEMSDEHFENHKAYIQSWISDIKNKPETLMKAIKAAEQAADYIEKAAEIEMEKDITKEKGIEKGGPDRPQEKENEKPDEDILRLIGNVLNGDFAKENTYDEELAYEQSQETDMDMEMD